MNEVTRSTTVAASPETVWATLAAFGDLARWASNVDHSCLLREPDPGVGAGVGTVRRVQTGRTTLLETVETWEPGRRLSYRIEGLPPVLRHVRNEWRLTPDAGGTTVRLTTTVDAGPRPPQRLVARLVGARLARESDSMLAGLRAAVEGARRG